MNKYNPLNIDIEKVYISDDETQHIYLDKLIYKKHFLKVLSFHNPGVAAVRDETGSYHINLEGEPIYITRYNKTFGYYQSVAAVVKGNNWYHIDLLSYI